MKVATRPVGCVRSWAAFLGGGWEGHAAFLTQSGLVPRRKHQLCPVWKVAFRPLAARLEKLGAVLLPSGVCPWWLPVVGRRPETHVSWFLPLGARTFSSAPEPSQLPPDIWHQLLTPADTLCPLLISTDILYLLLTPRIILYPLITPRYSVPHTNPHRYSVPLFPQLLSAP